LTISRKIADFCGPFNKQTGTTAKPHLLVVEDETKVAQFIKKGLETQGYTVEYRQAA
jgi:ActR/RegA family two-component response regulator